MKQLVISAKRTTAPIRESWIPSFRLNTMLNHRFKNIRPLQLQLALKNKVDNNVDELEIDEFSSLT